MKFIHFTLFTVFILMNMTSCLDSEKAAALKGRSLRADSLLAYLRSSSSDGYMFGHHDATLYGRERVNGEERSWTFTEGRCDVRDVCGDYPAIISFDLGHIELGDSLSLDFVPFDMIRKEMVAHYRRGGIVTASWHLNNPLSGGNSWIENDTAALNSKERTVASVLEGGSNHAKFQVWLNRLADFLNSVKTEDGEKIPILFRPWHEHTGNWFWWGASHCTPEQYVDLWKMTRTALDKSGADHLIYAYSPGMECGGDSVIYLERYPGDDLVDLLGVDAYEYLDEGMSLKDGNARYVENLNTILSMLTTVGLKHDKPVAVTEMGFEGIPYERWWTEVADSILSKHPVAYGLVWRNVKGDVTHHYAPYPGHSSAPDFIEFYNLKRTLFLKDICKK